MMAYLISNYTILYDIDISFRDFRSVSNEESFNCGIPFYSDRSI